MTGNILLTYFFPSIIYTGGADSKYCTSRFFIEKAGSLASRSQCPCAAVLAPACATPSAAAAGSAEGSFTRMNQSMAVPLGYPPSSVVPGLAFLCFPAALQGHAFAPLSAAVPVFAYAGTSAQAFSRAQITPRNVLTHTHFTLGLST